MTISVSALRAWQKKMNDIKKAFLICYNDFGEYVVIANSYKEAEEKFIGSEIGNGKNSEVYIKSIKTIGEAII